MIDLVPHKIGRPKLLILTFTDATRDPRPLKQISALKADYELTVAAFGQSPDESVEFVQLDRTPRRRGFARIVGIFSLLMLLRMYRIHELLDPRNQGPLCKLRGREWDLILAHDPGTLAVASKLKSKKGILVDLHEYSPGMDEPTIKWRLLTRPYFQWLCRTRVARASAATTVSQGIVDRYKSEFGFESVLVLNATPYSDLMPSALGSKIRLVHSGVAAPDRKLETLVSAVRDTKANVTLDFYLLDSFPEYVDELKALAGDDARIVFHDAVPYSDLISTLNMYDVGVHVIAPTSFNNLWALPNKFFDFVQARLGIIVGPSPAMAGIVNDHGLGVVIENFSAKELSVALDQLDFEQVSRWKHASHAAAQALAGEVQQNVWAEMVSELIARGNES